MRLTKAKQTEKPDPKAIIAALLRMFITAIILAGIFNLLGIASIGSALAIGFWLWLGFVAMPSVALVIWEKRPAWLWIMNNAYELIGIWIMAVLIFIW
jgi:hypothetical protein